MAEYGEVTNLDRALRIMVEAHAGQKHKMGEAKGTEYVTHPIRMVLRALELGLGEDVAVVAALHDVLEDTTEIPGGRSPAEAVAIKRRALNLVAEMDIEADLRGVTKVEGETYREFTERSALRRVSALVKLLDVEDHILEADTKETLGMVKGRYARAYRSLRERLNDAGLDLENDLKTHLVREKIAFSSAVGGR